MSIANKLVTIAENVNKVYESGKEAAGGEFYDKGYGDGYEAGYNKAESQNLLYYATYLSYAFQAVSFPQDFEAVIKLKKAPVQMLYLFNNSVYPKSIKFISEDKTNIIDFTSAFAIGYSSINNTTLEIIDFTEFNKKFSRINNAFQYQSKLKEIKGALDFSECVSASSAFNLCYALEKIEFVPNTIPISINFGTCTNLTHDSLMSIINGLAVVETTQTLTLGSTNLAKLTDEEKAIATEKGWTLA